MTKCTLKAIDPFQNSTLSELPLVNDDMEMLYVKVGLTLSEDHLKCKEACKPTNCTCPSCSLTLHRAILRLIAALPSTLGYREATKKLFELYRLNPDVFRSRKLYLAVHKVFVMFTFPLRIRRQVFNLFFSQHAQMLDKPLISNPSKNDMIGSLTTLVPNSILTAQNF